MLDWQRNSYHLPGEPSGGNKLTSVTGVTSPNGKHLEGIKLILIDPPLTLVVLGQLWLTCYNLQLECQTHHPYCHTHCLCNHPKAKPKYKPKLSDIPKSPKFPELLKSARLPKTSKTDWITSGLDTVYLEQLSQVSLPRIDRATCGLDAIAVEPVAQSGLLYPPSVNRISKDLDVILEEETVDLPYIPTPGVARVPCSLDTVLKEYHYLRE